ncbi:hypothetical protein ACWEOE_32460 [Amycolatopsis sp. NPDC004368]
MKRIASIAGVVALGAAFLTVGSVPANADPYDCSNSKPNNWSLSVKCENGTGEYRAYTKCKASLAFDYVDYGPWARGGNTSTAVCIRAGIKDAAVAPQGVQVR